MARQILNPAVYAMTKRMTFRQMNDYLLDIYQSGMADEKSQLLGDADEAVVFYLDDLKDILLEVDGVTPDIADKIVEKINTLQESI